MTLVTPYGGLTSRLRFIPWGLIFLLLILGGIGFLALYSAGGGSLHPWAIKHLFRLGLGVAIMLTIALIDIRLWYKLAYPFYGLSLLMLVYVEVMGHVAGGAQSWINLGFMRLQPSEIMKIAAVLALARYFQGARLDQLKSVIFIMPALGLVGVPTLMVMLQPDLGTAAALLFVAGAMFFLAGVAWWMFAVAGTAALACLPIAWGLLYDHQKQRVLTFLNPESDPLGSGYHITQSKIALGSGGLTGKGYLQGTQSHLDFLPEKHTDFIFTLWAEEWGLLGSLFLMAIFALVFAYGFWLSSRVHHRFGRLLVLGMVINFSIYAFINIAMVMGVIPVVGVPLVMISHGGTSMLAVMMGFGLAASAYVYRDAKMPKGGI